MKMASLSYGNFADFEREQLRPSTRTGWSVEELDPMDRDHDFDLDPFEASLWEAEQDDKDDYSDDA